MSITSKIQICNMSQGHLGNYASVEDIDSPETPHEIAYSLWYDISRQALLKMTIPNFAMARKYISVISGETVPYPFTYAYQYPSDCLKILGIGEVEEKKNNYTVEAGKLYTNVEYSGGLPLRYIKDITDVTKMSPEFKMDLSWYLASNVAMEITQDINKVQLIESLLPVKLSASSAINAQENKPIRISRSKFKASRYTGFVRDDEKR